MVLEFVCLISMVFVHMLILSSLLLKVGRGIPPHLLLEKNEPGNFMKNLILLLSIPFGQNNSIAQKLFLLCFIER